MIEISSVDSSKCNIPSSNKYSSSICFSFSASLFSLIYFFKSSNDSTPPTFKSSKNSLLKLLSNKIESIYPLFKCDDFKGVAFLQGNTFKSFMLPKIIDFYKMWLMKKFNGNSK